MQTTDEVVMKGKNGQWDPLHLYLCCRLDSPANDMLV